MRPSDGMHGQSFKVVVNADEQYSLWPSDRAIPAGWSDTNFQGTYDECLDHIAAVWTDMRPLSARRRVVL